MAGIANLFVKDVALTGSRARRCFWPLRRITPTAAARACAIAEAGWSPMGVRSWENFRRKLADHRQFILKRFNYDMERTQGNEPAFRWENNK